MIKHFFSNDDKHKIREALIKAERGTSGEIVPVIANISGKYEFAGCIFGLFFSIVVFSVIWLVLHNYLVYRMDLGPYRLLGLVVCIYLVSFIVGEKIASHFPMLKRPFLDKKSIHDQVESKACESFYKFGVGHTRGMTGILIYVSLFERRVVIKGDYAITEKLHQKDWEMICNIIITGIQNNTTDKAFVAAIHECGELLKKHFPSKKKKKNELENTIHILH
jgi:putative membrane protein